MLLWPLLLLCHSHTSSVCYDTVTINVTSLALVVGGE